MEGWALLLGSKFKDAELMQYRSPVGLGPSSNTCPKCASQLAQRTSVRIIPWLVSLISVMADASSGAL